MLSVVRVSQSISTTPAMTAGIVNPTARESRKDWKLAVSSRRMTPTAIKSPRRRPPNISAIGWTCPRTVIFAECGAVGNAGHIAQVDLSARPASDGQILDFLQGIHLVLGDLDLHLI